MERNRDDTFDALADPTRREILSLLSGRAMAAGEIARRFPQRRPAISKHLAILKRAGLLLEQRRRQCRIYSIRNETLVPVLEFLSALRPDSVSPVEPPRSKKAPAETLRLYSSPRAMPSFELEFD